MDETAIAFDRPLARSVATAGPAPLDRIAVRDFVRKVEIGAFKEERGRRQRVRFNVVLEVLPAGHMAEDDVDGIVSYDMITEAIEGELARERVNLLETVAERIAAHCLAHPRTVRAFVRVEKLDRIPGALGVEIVRVRGARPPEAKGGVAGQAAEVPHPTILYLSNAVLGGPALGRWIDMAARHPHPVIICTPPLPGFAAVAKGWPGRRIALLSMEQNAWRLASRDDRCLVVETRTEFDYAMKHGQLSVWAPMKIVMDAVEKPAFAADDPEALAGELAHWFAAELGARGLVVAGPGPQPPAARSGNSTPVLSFAAEDGYLPA